MAYLIRNYTPCLQAYLAFLPPISDVKNYVYCIYEITSEKMNLALKKELTRLANKPCS